MYLWLKSFHVIAVICWMAGLLYLFRLFIYHRKFGPESKERASLLEVMEYKLYRYITIPAMLVSWVLGLAMLHYSKAFIYQGWFHTKLLAVILLTGVTHVGGAYIKKLKRDIGLVPSEKKLRFINEIPTILMIIIVIMVIVKPF